MFILFYKPCLQDGLLSNLSDFIWTDINWALEALAFILMSVQNHVRWPLTLFQITSDKFHINATKTPWTIILSESHIFDAEKGVEYKLNKQLEAGDVIKAWGVYKDDSTSKFRYTNLLF